tara:strand:+ start:43 stop:216 length:174 start_codon:yes stop_codon:yes gene_type:complete
MTPLDKIILAFIFMWILKEMDIFFPIQIWVLGFYSKFQKDKDEEEVIEFKKILEELE